MRWEDAHKIAMLKAAHAHRDFGIDTRRRIDIFGAIEDAELILGFQPMSGLSGAYFAGAGILINANHPLARQRYTAAHEFGHHVFEHETSVDPWMEPLSRWGGTAHWTDQEKQAEAFAAWFLMPRQLVLESLRQLRISRPESPEDVYALALRLGTSYEATARHLPNLRLASRQQRDRWLKTQLAKVKVALAAGAPPESLRNDVWRLDERDDSTVIFVRVGDRLVIDLEDVPSSGYLWRAVSDGEQIRLVVDEFENGTDLFEEESGDENSAEEDLPIGTPVRHVFVLEVDPEGAATEEEVVLERVRPWTGDVADRFRLELDVEQPRMGVSEELMRIAA
jgi:Zn-dependent peptidase ImmA (M78 family)